MNYVSKIIALFSLSLCATSMHAHAIHQVTIMDSEQGSRTITYEEKNGFAMVEGDIILGRAEQFRHPSAVITTRIGGTRWRDGIIPFTVSEDLPFINKLAIFEAIAHWKKHSYLEFIEITSKNKHQYADYISFTPAGGTTCSSFVGRQGGMQEINLAPRCNTMNTVHEIGHAIGLWHEQSRADRNAYVTVVWENIEEQYKYNFDQQLSNGKDFGSYDYDSIMHYGPYSFSKNGQKTIIPLSDDAKIGQRNHLSAGDIEAAKAMYPQAIHK